MAGRRLSIGGIVLVALNLRQGSSAIAGLPAERRIGFRIGIHLGDVVEESDCAAESWRAVSAPRDAGPVLTRTTNGSLRQSDLWSWMAARNIHWTMKNSTGGSNEYLLEIDCSKWLIHHRKQLGSRCSSRLE
jgi:hypothetical protein